MLNSSVPARKATRPQVAAGPGLSGSTGILPCSALSHCSSATRHHGAHLSSPGTGQAEAGAAVSMFRLVPGSSQAWARAAAPRNINDHSSSLAGP